MKCFKMIHGFQKRLSVFVLLLFVVCWVAFSPFSSSANAIDYDVNALGSFLFDVPQSKALKSDGSYINFTPGDNANYPGMYFNTVLQIMEVHVKFDRTIPANSMLNFYVNATADEVYSDYEGSEVNPNVVFPVTPFLSKAYEGKAYLYEVQDLGYRVNLWQNQTVNPGATSSIPGRYQFGTMNATTYNIKMIVTQDINELVFGFSKAPTGFFQLIPGSYIGLVSPTVGFQSIEDQLKTNQDQQNQNAKDQLDATNKQTEQQKEQYEKDKQEEADRENQGSEDADKAQGMFDFSISNPFNPLFDMFNPRGCVSIPTIAAWLHSDNATYCSWFPSSVTAVLTPVFSLSSMILLFGFVVAWLNGGDSNGSITIKGGLK